MSCCFSCCAVSCNSCCAETRRTYSFRLSAGNLAPSLLTGNLASKAPSLIGKLPRIFCMLFIGKPLRTISHRTVFGTDEQVKEALKVSKCSRKVNTSFIERQNGTDRNRCSRKVRKSYCFSKDWDVHRAATCLSMYSYNFCWAVRTLKRPDGKKGPCTPAMSAGLALHHWTIREWLQYPACKC